MNDFYAPIRLARSFAGLLDEKGIEYDYAEVMLGNCKESPDYAPVLKFMSDNLVFEDAAP